MFTPTVTTGVPIPTTFEEAARVARIVPVSRVLNTKDKQETYSKSVTVPELYEHPDGYTVYTVVLTAVPKNSLDQDSIEYRIETRYKDLLKLWQQLSLAHRQLHLHGAFPHFPKPKLLGRKEPGTVLERRAAAEALLDFAVKDPILCKASVLSDFFEGSKAEEITDTGPTNLTPIPTTLPLSTSSDVPVPEQPVDIVDSVTSDDVVTDPLTESQTDFVDQFDPLADKEASSSRETETSNQWLLEAMSQVERESAMNPSTQIATPLPELFPKKIRPTEITNSSSTNSMPVFAIEDCSLVQDLSFSESPKTHCKVEVSKTLHNPNTPGLVLEGPSDLPNSPNGAVTRDGPSNEVNQVEITVRDQTSDKKSDSQKLNTRSRIAKMFPKINSSSQAETRLKRETSGSTEKLSAVEPNNGMKTTKSESNIVAILTANNRKDLVESPKSQSPNRLAASSPLKSRIKAVSAGEDLDYLVQAAQFISSAQKSEAEAAYDLAFSCYKSAVNVMLQGVQFEKDLARRNAVRKKTAKYLLKAERIYRSQLAFDSSSFDVQKWAADFAVSSPSVQDPTLISFQGSYSELKGLKFCKQLGQNTMLVTNHSKTEPSGLEKTAEQEDVKYVLKFLDKTWYFPQQAGLTSITDNYVPLNVPFMTNLVKFYETEPCVILLLEFVSNGRLWTFLSNYFRWKRRKVPSSLYVEELPENEEESPETDQNAETTSKPIFSPKNTYAGRKVAFSIGDGEGLEEDDDDNMPEAEASSRSVRAGSIFGRILSENHDRSSFLEEPDPEKVETAQKTVKEVLNKQDSICSDDSLSIEIGASTSGAQSSSPSPSNPGLNSPNPDLKFQNVFRKLSAEMGVFSIIDEEGEDSGQGFSEFAAPVMNRTSSKDSPKRISTGSKRDSLPPIDEIGSNRISADDPESYSDELFENDEEPISNENEHVKWPEGKDLPESVVKLWMGQLLVALTHLHAEGIILKCLNPRNLLLGNEGQLVLTYFSDWACVDRGINLDAVDHLYSAPETGFASQEIVHDTCDWWSVGALIYELISGWPLHSQCPQGIQSRTQIPFLSPDASRKSPARRYDLTKTLEEGQNNPSRRDSQSSENAEPIFSSEAQDLLLRLLTVNPKERLGQGEGGVEDIRSHPFFRELHWPQIDIPASSRNK